MVLILMQTLWHGAHPLWVGAYGVLSSLVIPACLLFALAQLFPLPSRAQLPPLCTHFVARNLCPMSFTLGLL